MCTKVLPCVLPVSGDLVIQSPEAEQLKNDGVIAALQDMFPDIAKQKVQLLLHVLTACTAACTFHA